MKERDEGQVDPSEQKTLESDSDSPNDFKPVYNPEPAIEWFDDQLDDAISRYAGGDPDKIEELYIRCAASKGFMQFILRPGGVGLTRSIPSFGTTINIKVKGEDDLNGDDSEL